MKVTIKIDQHSDNIHSYVSHALCYGSSKQPGIPLKGVRNCLEVKINNHKSQSVIFCTFFKAMMCSSNFRMY